MLPLHSARLPASSKPQASNVPKLFRHSGRIRNKHLSKRDTEKLVKEIWRERLNDPGGWAGWLVSVLYPACLCLQGSHMPAGSVKTVERAGWLGTPAASLEHKRPHQTSIAALASDCATRSSRSLSLQPLLPAVPWTCWSLCSSSCRRKWASSPQWWRCG